MKAIRVTINNGQIVPSEPLDVCGQCEAILVLADPDPWNAIVADSRPRSGLTEASQDALEEYLQGRTSVLDPDNMP